MIQFTHNFIDDFNKIYFEGEPYAFLRMADGERAFGMRVPIKSRRCGFEYDGTDTNAAKRISQVVKENVPGLYFGISCPCCDPKGAAWYREQVTCPDWQLSYSNLFANANYQRFQALDLKNTVLVACKNGDFTVPQHAINPEWDYRSLLQALFKVNKTILVAAGPIKCGLIYDYWTQAPNRQIIIDIGSALDMKIHGHPTREYHKAGNRNKDKVCVWHV